jgi:hypothetical protein
VASWFDRFRPKDTWLDNRSAALGVKKAENKNTSYEKEYFSGGQTQLEGTAYFRFFTILMLVAAVIYIPFAMICRPKSHLHH